jgi:hypothetical protein
MNSTSVATSANFTRRTLTVTEAAVCLGLSRNAAYQGIRDGTIPYAGRGPDLCYAGETRMIPVLLITRSSLWRTT